MDLPIFYKGKQLHCGYRVGFICYETILVETKAISQLSFVDEAQVINYMKATGLNRSLLLNFGPHRNRIINIMEKPTEICG